MRTVLALAILAASLMLGGCFHHDQTAYAEPLAAPQVNAPVK